MIYYEKFAYLFFIDIIYTTLKVGVIMNLSNRQKKIIDIIKEFQPITGNDIALKLGSSKSTIRSDLTILTYTNILIAKPKVGYIINNKKDKVIDNSIFNTKVVDIKSNAVFINENDSINDAIIQIFLHDAGTVFVINEFDYLCGVVSRKDFLKSILGNTNINSVPVNIIMTRMPNIITTSDEETIIDAAKKIIKHKIDALPVVEEIKPDCYIVTGRISKTTISKLFVQLKS